MKPEIIVPVSAALIAAFASVAGTFYNQQGALELERTKWRGTCLVERDKQLRDATSTLILEFSASLQRVEDFLWRVEMLSDRLTEGDFDRYVKASQIQQPKLAAAEVALAFTRGSNYPLLAPLLAELRRMDEQIVIGGLAFKRDRKQVLTLITDEVNKLPALRAKMREMMPIATKIEKAAATKECSIDA
jgi:hypothetical protein